MSNNLLAGTVSALFAKVDVLESDATRVRKELEEARAHAEQLELRRVQLDDAEEEHRQHFRKLYTAKATLELEAQQRDRTAALAAASTLDENDDITALQNEVDQLRTELRGAKAALVEQELACQNHMLSIARSHISYLDMPGFDASIDAEQRDATAELVRLKGEQARRRRAAAAVRAQLATLLADAEARRAEAAQLRAEQAQLTGVWRANIDEESRLSRELARVNAMGSASGDTGGVGEGSELARVERELAVAQRRHAEIRTLCNEKEKELRAMLAARKHD